MNDTTTRLVTRPSLTWIIISWVAALVVLYAVTHAVGASLLVVASPWIRTGQGMSLGPIAALMLWIAFGLGAIASGMTYGWLRSVGLK